MALVIEAIDANGVVMRTTVDASGQATLPAAPGTTYRIVDESGRPIGKGARAIQIDGDLVIDTLPSSETIKIARFFTDCSAQDPCVLSLEELGGGPGQTITPASEPVAALAGGGFLMNSSGTGSESIPREPGTELNWKPMAAGVGGLLVVAGAAGGGGGGGGSDTTAPSAPTLKNQIANSSTPVIEGTAEANSTVTISIDVGGNGQLVGYSTTADSNGIWRIDTATAVPVAGTMPPGGLPTDVPSPIGISARDAAGNTSQPLTTTLSVDTTPPDGQAALTSVDDDVGSITGAIADGSTTDDNTPLLTGSLTAPLGQGELVQVTRNGAVVGQALVSNLDWQFSDADLPDGAYTYTVQVIDAAGNTTAATAPVSFTVDTVAPVAPVIGVVAADDVVNLPEATLGITVSGTAQAGSTVEVVWGNTAARTVTVDNAGAWSTVYQSAQLPPDGTRDITVTAVDAAGNVSAATVRAVVIDQSEASLAITSSATGVTNDPATITFEFEEPVTGFTLSDITVTNATAGVLTPQAGGAIYTLELTPQASSQATASITVAEGVATDARGNGNTAASLTQAFDTARPSLVITDNIVAAEASGPVLFTFTFSEAVTGFTAADIAVTGGTKGTFAGSGSSYTLVVTPTGANGTIAVTVADGRAVDVAGNTNTAATAAQAFDTAAPTLTITNDVTPGDTATGPVTYRFTFNEPVTGFAANDITVTNGSKGAFTTVTAGRVYDLVVNPTAGSEGNIGVSARVNAAVDGASNGSPLTQADPQPFDTALPEVVITDDTAGVTNDLVTYTFTWSEDVTGFTFADITPITNGSATAGDFSLVTAGTPTTGPVYELVVTPDPNIDATMGLTVRNNAATDVNGNTSATTSATAQAIDTLRPDIDIDGAPGIATSPFVITFTFDEAVTGFTDIDIVIGTSLGVSTPTVGALQSNAANTEYTLLVTPAADENGTISFDVAANLATDTAGNGNTVAVTYAQSFDSSTAGLQGSVAGLGLDEALGFVA